jgi:diguanylate cyclase (GGDEF)-like protein
MQGGRYLRRLPPGADPLVMSASSHSRLIDRLQNWDYWPCAALFHIDLHDLRNLNRSVSPDAGDEVIAAIGRALKDWVGNAGHWTRLWSNEFVAAKAIDHPQAAVDEACGLRDALLATPLRGPARAWQPALSIGVVCGKPHAEWMPLLRQAELACEHAKRRGINQISTQIAETKRRFSTEHVNEFRQLLNDGALVLHPQPIMDIRADEPRLAKAEFLIRMEKNGVHMPLPQGMIESLEHFGMSTELDRFSSNFILAWLQSHTGVIGTLSNVSINLSGKSIADGAFMYKLFNEVRGANLPHGKLTFEITETTAIEHLDVASDLIAEFRSIGCGFSLDDFGSGLCSFGYLQSLPVQEIKIDGRFVRGVEHEQASQEIIRAIRQVAHATGKKTVAEFVDHRGKLGVLRKIGVDYAQGYLFYPTVTPEKLLSLLAPAAAEVC